jgi:hypothetical protein
MMELSLRKLRGVLRRIGERPGRMHGKERGHEIKFHDVLLLL